MTEKSPLQIRAHREMVKFLVSKQITCPRTGVVLDYRTCVVLLDRDGDPTAVVSQEGWKQIVAEGGDEKLRLHAQVTVDPETVKA
jgi:hypothetical protein